MHPRLFPIFNNELVIYNSFKLAQICEKKHLFDNLRVHPLQYFWRKTLSYPHHSPKNNVSEVVGSISIWS